MTMKNNFSSDLAAFGPEWIILENIVRDAPGDQDTISTILSEHPINWGQLLEQAINHKILPMVSWFFLDEKFFNYIPPFVNQYIRTFYDLNRHKSHIILEQTTIISEALKNMGVRFACTKGTVLENQLYGGHGYRFLSDTDFIFMPEHKAAISMAMKNMGYIEGSLDWKNNIIRPLTREEHLIYLNTPDKLPEFVKEIDDPMIRYVSAGFTSSFTWNRCPYAVDIAPALKDIVYHAVPVFDSEIPSMKNSFHFIYIILHLYKHAWLEYLARWNNDVNLVKFGDVYRFWLKYEKELKSEIPALLNAFQIKDPVKWVLAHTDQVFGSSIVKLLNLDIETLGLPLNGAGDKQGNLRTWKGTMRKRLSLKDRSRIFT